MLHDSCRIYTATNSNMMKQITFENSRQPKVLYLIANSSTPITAHYISSYLNISVRIVRYEIQALKLKCKYFGCEVIATPRIGYSLSGNRDGLIAYLKSLLGELYPFANTGTKEKFVREQLILRYLIIQNRMVPLQELMDEFSFSRQTILDNVRRANETIDPYHMKIEYLPYKGIIIHGSETQKRMLLARETAFLKTDQLIPYIHKTLSSDYFKAEDLLSIINKNLNLHISQVELFNLYTHIMVQIFRVSCGHLVSEEEINISKYHIETYINPIEAFIKHSFPTVPFTSCELFYLTNLIFASSFSNDTMEETSTLIIEQLTRETSLLFSSDLTKHLGLFIVPLLIKSENRISSIPVKVREIKRLKPLSIELAYRISLIIKDLLNLDLFYNDICSLAYLVESSVVLPRSKNALVSLSIGWLLSQSVIKSLSARYVNFNFDYFEPFDVPKINQTSYQLLITDTPTLKGLTSIPSVTIDTILSTQCVQRIDNFIESQRRNYYRNMMENALPLKLDSIEQIFSAIALQYDIPLSMLLNREDVLTYEVNKTCVVICLFTNKPSVLYHLSSPLFWKNEIIEHIFIFSVHHRQSYSYDDVINFIEHQSNLDSEL